jgi:hypothetical protein
MGAITNGEVSGYDKGFGFVVQLDSLAEFTDKLEMQREHLLG